MPAANLWVGLPKFRNRNTGHRNSKQYLESSQTSYSSMQSLTTQQPWTAEAVASLPPPGLSGPGQIVFSPSLLHSTATNNSCASASSSSSSSAKPKRFLAFVSSPSTVVRAARIPPSLYRPLTTGLYPVPTNSAKQSQQQKQHQQQQPAHLHNQLPPHHQNHLNPATTGYSAAYNQPHYAASGLAIHDPTQPPHPPIPPQKQQSTQRKQQEPQQPGPPPPASGQHERVLLYMDLTDIDKPLQPPQPMLRLTRQSRKKLDGTSTPGSSFSSNDATPAQDKMSLQERLRRERQRLTTSSGSLTQFSWTWCHPKGADGKEEDVLRILIPTRGNLYIQDDVLLPEDPAVASSTNTNEPKHSDVNEVREEKDDEEKTEASLSVSANNPRCIHDKSKHSPSVDPQLSPDGSMVAWTADGEIYVQSCGSSAADAKRFKKQDKDKPGAETCSTTAAPPVRVTFGAVQSNETCIRHGVADFVAQEEMDRYRGFWWHPDSTGILLVRVDESAVPPFRILHHDASFAACDLGSDPYHGTSPSAIPYEDHRYPFAGRSNPTIQLAYVEVNRESIIENETSVAFQPSPKVDEEDCAMEVDDEKRDQAESSAQLIAKEKWSKSVWFDSPREASEYLARVHWLPDGSVAAQWQNRAQNATVLTRMDLKRGKIRTLLTERSEVWINLHHLFKVLPDAIHPDDCIATEKHIPPMPNPLPEGSFSFLHASERSGYQHLYLYTFVPGIHGEQAILLRTISSGDWMVESIVGVDAEKDAVYVTGTFDSPLERHLYALPLLNRRLVLQDASLDVDVTANHGANGVRRGISKVMNALSGKGSGRSGRVQEAIWASMRPVRLTIEPGMHSIVMDDECEIFVDTSSDLDRPTSSRIFELPDELWGANIQITLKLVYTIFDAIHEDNSLIGMLGNHPSLDALPSGAKLLASLPPPELVSFPTSDGAETLHAALYRPDPRIYGPGPYPLVCAVYGGPHVQRVNRSWSQCADMRAQRLRSLGFCVVKCDNRGSSRRGIAFESSISRRLGKIEVLDQVAVVRQLTLRGIVDSSRVGVYGWSYGGYLAAMCLCRAPDVFSCAVSGAPVTSWDGYDTHYTERYMGHPGENGAGYRESAVFDHIPNMRGKLMIVHGLLDENVHFRHTARLINKLVANGKDYDLLLFPEERHSPRRLRDRIYMEQRISNFFLRHLSASQQSQIEMMNIGQAGMRPLGGHL